MIANFHAKAIAAMEGGELHSFYGRRQEAVDELVAEALGDGLDVPEGGLPGTGAEQPDGLVHPAQRRHVDGLPAHGARTADPRAVLPGARVDDGVYHNLGGGGVRGRGKGCSF